MCRSTTAALLLLIASVAAGQPAPQPIQSTTQPAQSTTQTSDNSVPAPLESENWNLYFQATSVGQQHGSFYSPYQGPLSLQPYAEHDVSLTTTLFLDFRLDHNTQVVFNPEIAGGRGFSNVDGLGDPSNGELPRVASATPTPYLARLYVTHDFALGDEQEYVESDENQLAGYRPVNRFTVTVGRFSDSDFFDDNAYSHDPRMQFLAWGLMYNGAWDYPADTRGYTWGIVNELHTRNWSFTFGSAAEPRVANGERFDRRLLVDQGSTFQEERRYAIHHHPGAIRWLQYLNRTRSGSYVQAVQIAQQTGTTPSVQAIRQPGTAKYGTGISFDQEITRDIGVFSRLGWNDGRTEDFAFTAIDRIAEGGVSVNGTRWHRKDDVVASAFSAAGISGVHAVYLALGGLDFLIGDGALSYAPEYLWESYYSAHVYHGLWVSLDAQHYNNPAYNHARGPLWVESVRLHVEFGLKPFIAK